MCTHTWCPCARTRGVRVHAHVVSVCTHTWCPCARTRGVRDEVPACGVQRPQAVRCEEPRREVRTGFEVEPRAVNGDHNHVHVHPLVHHPPKVALSTLAGSPKGLWARMLGKEYGAHVRRCLWGGHSWSGSSFAASVGGAPLTVLEQYIEQRKRPV
ncbi:IS200/IS605 family transposase [Streptosporangium sp. NPDC087985]|uniref:IS200/IS605 family transposase n=1 Tax=Streptosporangium sp. NPDC087985 TaxID=3366196 RepID=UPI00381C46E4